jgi:hypothetical protein
MLPFCRITARSPSTDSSTSSDELSRFDDWRLTVRQKYTAVPRPPIATGHMRDPLEQDSDLLFQEILRILGPLQNDRTVSVSLLLPLVDEKDALAFFRSVPTGSSMAEIQRMAAEFRTARPLESARDRKRE